MSIKTTSCPGGCEHTDHEHQAFDDGREAGERGDEQRVPTRYRSPMAREGWLAGHSVGTSNRSAEQR